MREGAEGGRSRSDELGSRTATQLERVFLPFRGGNRVCSGREDCLSRDPFPATARHRRSLLPISRCRFCTGESLTSSSLLPKRKTRSVSREALETREETFGGGGGGGGGGITAASREMVSMNAFTVKESVEKLETKEKGRKTEEVLFVYRNFDFVHF